MSAAGYLVQYGRSGFVGRFASADPLAFARGDRAVVRTPRGTEVGTILCEATDRFARHLDTRSGGELLRAVSTADGAEEARLAALGAELLEAADAAGLPVAFADAEPLLDGTVILHAIPWADCDADALLAALSLRFGVTVQFFDVSRVPAEKDAPDPAPTCGKPDCGTGGGCSTGGCSTGSCSRGAVKSADELTAYFADLRTKMEAAGMGRTPLN
jgi:hypothetical protein